MPPTKFQPRGVIPACLLPFTADLQVDTEAYRQHLRDVAGVAGVSAITVNGHAAEVHALSEAEQQQAIEVARDTVGEALPLVAGICAADTRGAARVAEMAARSGADALLLFPSPVWAVGGQQRPDAARAHVADIASATDLPLILFQYPLAGGLGYPLDTLLQICREIPAITAIKDWCNDPVLHERQIRELHALDRRINILSTHSAWLLPSLVLGCDGLLSGAGSVIANLQVALWQAVESDDLRAARQINDRIYPTVRAFYGEPLADMHNRMKEALVLLGRLPAAYVRPPLVKLSQTEIGQIESLLRVAGVTPASVYSTLELPPE